MSHKLIGEILKETGRLSEDVLSEGLKQQKEDGGRLGEILIKLGAITEENLLEALSIQFDIPYLQSLPAETEGFYYATQIPIHYLKRYNMVPVIDANGVRVAFNDPLLFQPLDDLRIVLEVDRIEPVLSSNAEILSAINRAYDLSKDSAEQFVQDMDEEDSDRLISEIEETADLLDDTSDAPVIKLVNLTLAQAVKARASDIHIEPYQSELKVRYRIDGVLYNTLALPKRVQSTLISRVKIMAKLNIAEKRLPQDGRIEIKIAEKNIDIRVSTIPTTFGERVVLRLLDKATMLLDLAEIGLVKENLLILRRIIQTPHGIILVTGPTGSGKTTTLYSALNVLNKPDINIMTIEDPVEYQLNGANQIQVNPKIDLTFAKGLRSIVRQDPDVILVGEIRDLETAEIAVQSSLTGHLVFSTLHTNDAASAVTRLIDMGIEPFLVTSSAIAILAQRLVRVICKECKEAYILDEESLQSMDIDGWEMLQGKTIYRGRGCDSCLNTGYKGRTGIFEVMLMNDDVRNLILKTSDAGQIKKEAVKQGMSTLGRDGIQKVLEGITTLEEVVRVTR
ncbi:MAG: type II secretion system ATPase GspE [Deltaproteobacteria bacterium]|nr:type II secretion system ATPase GspE [Deltaproteobacteria bacterium]